MRAQLKTKRVLGALILKDPQSCRSDAVDSAPGGPGKGGEMWEPAGAWENGWEKGKGEAFHMAKGKFKEKGKGAAPRLTRAGGWKRDAVGKAWASMGQMIVLHGSC